MMRDAKSGKFDLIITKEVSRFARNTVDTLTYTRELKKMGVFVHFLLDNIQTDKSNDEFRLTVMASIAQEESRKISERVKFGQSVSMNKGVVFGNGIFGYHLEGGKLIINEDEAPVIRRIYHDYLIGRKGACVLATELQEDGIKTRNPNVEWNHARVMLILKNEKYCGILKQRKTIVTDYLEQTKKINKGEEEFIIIEDNHERYCK